MEVVMAALSKKQQDRLNLLRESIMTLRNSQSVFDSLNFCYQTLEQLQTELDQEKLDEAEIQNALDSLHLQFLNLILPINQ
jgi:hypothetical protein